MSYLFTSESVSEGHPDKIADAISDAVLDLVMSKENPALRCACETLVTTNRVVVAGEYKGILHAEEVESAVRRVIKDVGYEQSGFDWRTVEITNLLHGQSVDIALGTDTFGAGDQGLMFGYAIRDTPELMPLPIALAHRLARRLTEARKSGRLDYLRPDGKTQVTIQYAGTTPIRLDTVVLSTQHAEGIDLVTELAPDIRKHVVDTVLADLNHETLDVSDFRLLVNPTGKFVVGGPMGDAGLTGRKIIVDTYGGWARHGGGAFSGKDPSKVDRSAAYAMRWVAKNVVAAGLADRVEVQVAYAIGKAAPVGLFVETFGSETVEVARIEKAITAVFDLRPGAIVRDLDLLRPIYAQTAAYGHFGRTDIDLPWERLDKVEDLKSSV